MTLLEDSSVRAWLLGMNKRIKNIEQRAAKKLAGIKGLTMVELLISVLVLLIIVAAAIPIYGNFQVFSQLNENTSQFIQTLRLARERSAAGANNFSHGVKLQSNRYILYQGSSYTLRQASYDREILLSNTLNLSWTLTGAGEEGDINFSKGLGAPNKVGTIILTNNTDSRSININDFGLIEEE